MNFLKMYRLLLVLVMITGCSSDHQSNDDARLEPVFEFKEIAELDSSIIESSGITSINDALFTHSDEQGKAELIQLNTDGSINDIAIFENISVRDWEDVAVSSDYFYIGDIGNNSGNKTDLKILKVPRSLINDPNPNFETIEFSFADQTDFDNTTVNQTSYDVEAFTVFNDDLFIFTKDWLGLSSTIYRVDNTAGIYSLDPLATLDIDGLVTGATTSPEGDIIICGYNMALAPFVARIGIEGGIPSIKSKRELNGITGAGAQIEGITYNGIVEGVATYYLTSERFSRNIAGEEFTLPANLYELKWNE